MDIGKKQIIASSLIFLLLLSFAFLDIGLYSSNTNSDSSTGASSYGDVELRSDYNDIILYVHQEDSLDAKAEEEIVNALEMQGFSVTLTHDIRDDYGSPFAYVNIVESHLSYTPVYSSSEITLQFGLSSSGRTEYLDINGTGKNGPIVFTYDGTVPYQLIVEGDIDLHDETRGLFSYKAYRKHIAQEIARYTSEGFESQIKM